MSLSTLIGTWKGIYDNTGINENGGNPDYIGSVIDVNGDWYDGANIYSGVGNEIREFNWYAGQGVAPYTNPALAVPGGKYLVESTGGFEWDTVSGANALAMQTSGALNTLYLGTSADVADSPAQATVGTFDEDQPLLVIQGFNYVVNYAATLFGASDGNDTINMTDKAGTLEFKELMSKEWYYESATFNSAVLYNLAFEENTAGVSVFEWALDKYLESKGSDITDDLATIQSALTGTGVSIDYYEFADDYAAGGVIASANSAFTEVESDLLLAA
ncbi:hypothetical protein NUK34_09640 [Kerstersia gyiorum]|uniref:hypothetical protein n=1 Tax=Kerstersia gyiorum TaxID=206506 RepID=UPI00214F61D1|nr:hypothetical protein [Kerstersia gyiorum]MCR4159111.1 hypothetical protein [Kerstersia gyiorum]